VSRNLSSTTCQFCDGEVALDEPARPITKAEAGRYYETREGYGYAGGLFANATCTVCGAQYLAWVDLSACDGYGSRSYFRKRESDERPFFDLSHRRSFNDEPGEEDLPDWQIRRDALTPAECASLGAVAGTAVRRAPWPRCAKTGRKMYSVYGCDCGDHRA
jgi:hypothetical protein